MRIGGDVPKVVRLSRKVLIGLGGAGAVVLGGALVWALGSPRQESSPRELINTDTRQTSEALNTLPKDYAAIPRLGPPLPGDLGRPMLAAGVQPEPQAAAGSPAPDQTRNRLQAREQARLRLAQEREAARASRLFAAAADAASPAPPVIAAVAPATPGTAAAGAAPTSPGDRDRSFLTAPGDAKTTASGRLASPLSPYLLQAGAVIPAALITGVRSDLPGQITAQVTENVYDSATGRFLLIPQGARLVGEYDAETRFGQRRALLVWTRLILPDGRSMLLDREPGADAQGAAGLSDRVNNHWGQTFKAALVSTILGIGSEAGMSADESELIRALGRGGSDAVANAGQRIVDRSLDISPTLTIRPGYPVRVIVTRDLILQPWSE
jgi:type IV secretion system protein VirB10